MNSRFHGRGTLYSMDGNSMDGVYYNGELVLEDFYDNPAEANLMKDTL